MSATLFGRLNLYFWCCSRGGIREAACWQHSERAQRMHSTYKLSSMLHMRPWCVLAAQRMCTAGTDCILRKCLVSMSCWQQRGCAQQQRPAELYAMVLAVLFAGSAENEHSHQRAEDFARCWQHSECAQRRQMWGGIFGRKFFKSTVSGWDFFNFNSGKIRILSDFHPR